MTRAGRWAYIDDRSPGTSALGVSFSGGGIRSAAFCLGAYQALSGAGLFQKARYLSAVSGGSYIAAALTVAQGKSDVAALSGEAAPWSRGSPEEHYLRTHLSYLAPGLKGRLWLVVNFVYGLLLNLLPLIAGSYLAGRLIGLAYGLAIPGIGTSVAALGHRIPFALGLTSAFFLGSIVLVGVRRFIDRSHAGGPRDGWLRTGAIVLLALSVGALGLLVLLPLLVHILGVSLARIPFWIGQANGLVLRRILAAVVMVLFVMILGAVAVLLMQVGKARRTQGLLAFLGGWGILAIPFLLAAEGEARRGWNFPTDVLVALGATALLIVCGIFVHNRMYSMHLYYRERLSNAFVLKRRSVAGDVRVEPVPYDEAVRLSELGAEIDAKRRVGLAFPELVVCAAVAAREGDVPNKSWAASFTFDATCSGSIDLAPRIPTTRLEAAPGSGGSDLTLPSMMAISGAAISPTMGRFTLPALRLLMALLNLRLGVWIANPFRVDLTRTETGAHVSATRRTWEAVVAGWREPGGYYVMREALGLAGIKGRFIHVSDGGHWENLGLVELIRRRCTHIVVVDASAGGRSPLQDIARAAALARADLGAEIRLDPEATLPAGDARLAQLPFAVGSVTYPDGSVGAIYYVRCVLWEGVPMDLRVFREKDHQFPQHPTAHQLFSGEQFDAYRALGFEAAAAMGQRAHIPVDQFDVVRRVDDGDEPEESVLVM